MMEAHHKTYITGILIVLSTLLFNACSSGGSSSSSDSNPPVTSYTVSGTFTGQSSNGLVLQNNGADDLAIAGVSFEFATALADGASYDVTVLSQPTGQYCDVALGNGTINAENVSNIMLTCRGWGTASAIETDDADDAHSQQIAIDNNGNALAVWQQSDGTRFNIWSNRYTVGSGWGLAELIETDNSGHARRPQIAIDAAGNALAIWEQYDGTRNNIWSNRYTAGSGWGTAELIESNNAGGAVKPQIAVNSAGDALAVWEQSDGTRNNIWANRYDVVGGWGTAELIETQNVGDAYNQQIAIDAAGNAMAVWRQWDGIRFNLYTNRYTVADGWGTAELFVGSAFIPRIAMDSIGNALIVWVQFDGALDSMWANRYTAASGWGTPELIETLDAGAASHQQIAIDAAGNAMAVWRQIDGPLENILFNRYTTGSGWGTAEVIDIDNGEEASNPDIAIDAAGNAIAVWTQYDGTRNNIWANRYTAGKAWGMAELIETQNLGYASTPRIAMDATGNALVVWNQEDALPLSSIWSNRFE